MAFLDLTPNDKLTLEVTGPDQLLQVNRKVQKIPDVESSASPESQGSEELDEDDIGLPEQYFGYKRPLPDVIKIPPEGPSKPVEEIGLSNEDLDVLAGETRKDEPQYLEKSIFFDR